MGFDRGEPRTYGGNMTHHALHVWIWSVFLVVTLLASPVAAGEEDICIEIGESDLFLDLSTFPDLKKQPQTHGDIRGYWTGWVGSAKVDVTVWNYCRKQWPAKDVEHLVKNTEFAEQDRNRVGSDPRFAFQTKEVLIGPYGEGSYAILCIGDYPCVKEKTGDLMILCGLLDQHCYHVRVQSNSPLAEDDRKAFIGFLKEGVRAEWPVINPEWTDDEVKRRWEASVPDRKTRTKLKPVYRTEHYILFTTSRSGKRVVKQMERNYAQLEKVLPGHSTTVARLLPIFVFDSKKEYFSFYAHLTGRDPAQFQGSTGHGKDDYYATYRGAATDAMHMRGVALQYLVNRLRCRKGGPWFRTGFSYYMCTKPRDLKGYARDKARVWDKMLFPELFGLKRLDRQGRDTHLVLLSASIHEFVHKDRMMADKYPEFVRRMSQTEPGDAAAAAQVIEDLYGLSLEAFEALWVTYWKAR